MAVNKCLLLPALLLVLVVTSSATYNFFKPATDTTFTKVNTVSFLWSGHTEGETILVKSNEPAYVLAPPNPAFNRFSLTKGVNEAARSLGSLPLLPTILPEGMKYADVYVGPDIIIVYGYEEAEDYRSGDVGIEIGLGPRRVPTPEEMRKCLQEADEKLIQVGDIWVAIKERAHDWESEELYVLAIFYYNNLRYSVWARPPLTPQDVTRIIESMMTR